MYERYDAGRLAARALADSGVDHLFCLHGGHIDPILYGADAEGIRLIDTRHEQAAAHMAEGYALATGSLGVCAVTAGPGITDAITGLANANMGCSPIVCLSGSSPIKSDDTWTLQDMAQLPMVRPVTKWARVCSVAERAGEYAVMAMAEALGGRPGPAYLELPLDVVSKAVDSEAVPRHSYQAPTPAGADPDLLPQVVDLIEKAERPIVIAGSGAHWSGASEALGTLAATIGLPVFTTNAGRGIIPDSNPWGMGPTMPMGNAFGAALGADLVICLGTRLGFTMLDGKLFTSKTVIRVDMDPGETLRNRPGEINLVADVAVFCRQLAAGWEGGPTDERREWAKQLKVAGDGARKAYFAQAAKPGDGIHPLSIVESICEVGGDESTFVADGGDSMIWAMTGYRANGPGHILGTNAYFGCLGVGIPFAIAAKLARPESPVILMQGDGSFGLNAMEFDTAIRHNIPFVCLVANDNAWGMSRHGQGLQFGYDSTLVTELGPRPYHEMVKGLGGYGEMVTEADGIADAIRRAIDSNLPACINVPIDPSIYSPATAAMLGL